jgi:prepilin-type processing-associated H-X9-DG protein
MTNSDGTIGDPITRPKDIDASYCYLGWMFDKVDEGFRPIDDYPMIAALVTVMGGIAPTGIDVPIQLAAGLNAAFNNDALLAYTSHNGLALMAIADRDLDITGQPNADGYGNGGGNTIYRLREGIERFLITDINNPAASAQAQSEVFIMMDELGAGNAIDKYNHVPGGCNVLYMDGHVQFVRYVNDNESATAPVSPSVAIVVGGLSAGS